MAQRFSAAIRVFLLSAALASGAKYPIRLFTRAIGATWIQNNFAERHFRRDISAGDRPACRSKQNSSLAIVNQCPLNRAPVAQPITFHPPFWSRTEKWRRRHLARLIARLCFYQEQLTLAQSEEWFSTSWIGAVAEHGFLRILICGNQRKLTHAEASLFASIWNATVSAVGLPRFVQFPTIMAAARAPLVVDLMPTDRQ